MSSRTRGEDDEEVREVSEEVREAEEGLGVSRGPAGRGEVVGGGRETVVKQIT